MKNLTVFIDPESNECLYINGKVWDSTGEVTVYACDIHAAAGGEPVVFEHRRIDWCFDQWPATLEEAMNDPDA